VGSGGTVAAALNGAEGAGDAVLGAHVAPTMERLHHLLDVHDANWARSASGRDAVERLAAAAARAATSQWAVAVGPLQEDGFVEVAFRRPTGAIESERVALRGVGELARSRFVTHLLDRLRRKMQQSAESK
jgi:nicotinamide mononucleotide (NMN) deamidase PncC